MILFMEMSKMPELMGSWERKTHSTLSAIGESENCSTKEYTNSNLKVALCTINKFEKDKLFSEIGDWFVLIEGVILNKSELYYKFSVKNMHELCNVLIKRHGDLFFKEFRGSFSGLIQNTKNNITTLFTDHIGDKQMFYSEKHAVFSSSINGVLKTFKKLKTKISINTTNAYALLTLGYMVDNNTIIEDVEKLHAGTCLRIDGDKISTYRYHKFSNTTKVGNIKFNDAIENIDEIFNNTMRQQVNKNDEYGYANYAPLSAGLDSRITVFALNKFISEPILNFTYSQSNYYDEITAKRIANDIGNQWLFKSLDNGYSLKQLDESTKITGSQILYYGPGQVLDTLQFLEKRKMGLIHTGMLGDVILSTGYMKTFYHTDPTYPDAAYSDLLLNKFVSINGKKSLLKYDNQEIFNLYNKGFNGANMGSPLVFQEYTESFSPFYGVEMIEYCLSLPIGYRWDNNIYYEWTKRKYPSATKYPHNGRSMRNIINIKYKNRSFTIKEFSEKVINRVTSKYSNPNAQNRGMNPILYWYNNNSEIKLFMDDYFQKYIDLIENVELKEDCAFLYYGGTGVEKTQVLSLLSLCNMIQN
jgi:asparagine synthase (glutamine-hydrolysing)